MIVIIPCGARKLDRPAQAQHIYTGSYHRMCQRYARKLAREEDIYILSAKYGLLRMTDHIEPYSLTLGQSGAVSIEFVRKQATDLGIIDTPCIALGGRRYTDYCRHIWKECKTPLCGIGGNGKQMAYMKARL